MNSPTNTSNSASSNPELDAKITSMLRQIDVATSTPPAFDDLVDAPATTVGSRPNWMTFGAAASIVALGVGGLVLLGNRDQPSLPTGPAASVPGIDGSTPPGVDSVPLDEPSIGTEPEVEPDEAGTDPASIGLGDPLVGAALPADAAPLFELDRPDWVKQYVYGNDDQPLGDTNATTVVLVGDEGPTFDQPFVSLSVFDATGFDISEFGESVEVGGVEASVSTQPSDIDTGLDGPIVNMTIPLDGELALVVNSVRLGVDATVAIASSVDASADRIEVPVIEGFRQLPGGVPASWRNFSYRWGFDDGTDVAEPVVISTPTAAEEIPQQPSIEVVGSNLGPIGLAGRISQEARENRVVNGVDMAYRPLLGDPGRYWVDWIDGDWSYYAIGSNLDSEEQFFDLIGSLRLTDAQTFAASGPADIVIDGSQAELAADILGDVALTTEQLEQAATVSMPTGLASYQFELYLGLGCAASFQWLAADTAGDAAGRAEALAVVEATIALPDDSNGLPSNVGLESLADPMRSGDAANVALFGSNDCPQWSR